MDNQQDTAYSSNPPMHTGVTAKTYLVPSILVTIFCCQIFGIVAIVYAAIATGKNSSGDYAGAAEAGGKAKMWMLIGLGIGLVAWVLYLGMMAVGIVAGAASATTP